MEAFGVSEKICSKLDDGVETKLHKAFLDGLREDENGNILYEKVDNDLEKLQYSSRPIRGCQENKLEVIHNECEAVKQKVVENLLNNVKDQIYR